jgi:hypothetical protein
MHTPRCLKSQRCLQIKGNDWQLHSVAVLYFLKSELRKHDDLLIFSNSDSSMTSLSLVITKLRDIPVFIFSHSKASFFYKFGIMKFFYLSVCHF